METVEQIRLWGEFLSEHYYAELLEQARKHNYWIQVDFGEISRFSIELADEIIKEPEEQIKAAEVAIGQMDLPGERKPITVRFFNIPESQRIRLREIRSSDLEKLLWTRAVVRNKGEVRPRVVAAKFECPACGNVINILQLDKKLKEPTKCSCGRKGRFKKIHEELIDAQGFVVEEASEDLDGGAQPKRMNVLVKNDLTSPHSEQRTNPGSKIILTGIVKLVPILLRTGGQSTNYDIIIEGNNVQTTQEDFTQLEINEEEKQQILALSEDPKLVKKMVDSLAPTIYGHDKIKEGLLLQLFGGVRKQRPDGVVTRGDTHILLIGDPGAAKSQMLKRLSVVAPKSRYTTGRGATGAGLAASVVKDEFLQGWSLEAGALVLAHKGLCLIDELDKMSKEDSSSMHEALEQQSVSISKANIQATLVCETSVVAAANPKLGRFDPYLTVAEQINLPVTLINRFDLIYVIRDIPDATTDERLASFVLSLHQNTNAAEAVIDTQMMRKYIAYAKQNIFPKITDEAIDELRDYYIKMRASGKGEGHTKTIPISARQLEGLVRLTEASARLRLSLIADKRDAKRAIDLVDYCLRQVAFDEQTGALDIDRLTTGVSATQRNKISIIRETLNELTAKLGKTFELKDLIEIVTSKGVTEQEAEEVLEKMRKEGEIFEPRRGMIQKM
ncbi:minichromosome maintenance protein MCM [Candidatus Woesearchaeota archaeon]|nr:minichromosome maintenance protein MCM [Candidatus Woesearchaeota archaeon]